MSAADVEGSGEESVDGEGARVSYNQIKKGKAKKLSNRNQQRSLE